MSIARNTVYFFCLLYILFVPVELFLFSFQEKLTAFIFTDAISFTAHSIFGKTLVQPKISSDSLALYVLVLLLLVVALILAITANYLARFNQKREAIFYLCRTAFVYYLSLELFIYGADKIFKAQFYLPEPNILYTPLGFVSRDLLYWSTIGSSYTYSVFLGLVEVLAALLLIFQRTRITGLLIAAVLLINIVMVNFGFDISVKLHSSFLCFLTLLLLWPYVKTLYRFFILKTSVQLSERKFALINSQGLKTGFKTFAISILLFEAFYPFIKTRSYNDDVAARPIFHGAYQVNRETLAEGPPIKRFFIHRDGYLIFQNNGDEMKDYKLFVDTINKQFLVFDYNQQQAKIPYEYSPGDSTLTLHYFYINKTWPLQGRALKWKQLPAVKKQFHWMVEDVH